MNNLDTSISDWEHEDDLINPEIKFISGKCLFLSEAYLNYIFLVEMGLFILYSPYLLQVPPILKPPPFVPISILYTPYLLLPPLYSLPLVSIFLGYRASLLLNFSFCPYMGEQWRIKNTVQKLLEITLPNFICNFLDKFPTHFVL